MRTTLHGGADIAETSTTTGYLNCVCHVTHFLFDFVAYSSTESKMETRWANIDGAVNAITTKNYVLCAAECNACGKLGVCNEIIRIKDSLAFNRISRRIICLSTLGN